MHRCRHADGSGRAAVRIAHADGADEFLSFDDIAAGAARFAHWLDANGDPAGRAHRLHAGTVAAFYVCLFGAMQTGAISVPLFTLFGPDGCGCESTTASRSDADHQCGEGGPPARSKVCASSWPTPRLLKQLSRFPQL
jgi:acyl-CoA synthetase (AMP-forming)/AMP-acid ligase II